MSEIRFKIGDRVRCVPFLIKVGDGQGDIENGGIGYKPNKIFTIRVITMSNGCTELPYSTGSDNIVWNNEELEGGVYLYAIEYVDPLISIIHQINDELSK